MTQTSIQMTPKKENVQVNNLYHGCLKKSNSLTLLLTLLFFSIGWGQIESAGARSSKFQIASNSSSVVAPPWSEGFELSGVLPNGWQATPGALGVLVGNTSDLNPALSSQYIYSNLHNGKNSTTIITPVIGSIPSNYRFVVKYKLANYYHPNLPPASGSGNFVVAVSTNNGTSFTDVQTVVNNGIAGWQEYALNLSAYEGQNIRIRLTGNWLSGDYYLGFDNFSVEAMPICYSPTALTSSAISYQTATIAWTASPSIGCEYEVRTSGEAGSGATGLVASGTTTASTVSASLTGLNSGTTYTYYVRSNCGGGNFSSWSSATFATVGCNVPTAITSSAITATTATISWTAPVSGSPVGYEYEIRTSGAAGSGATGLVTTGTTTASIVTASLTNLTATTTYSVYVRSTCHAGLNSAWTSVVTFTTSSKLWSESFETTSTMDLNYEGWMFNNVDVGTISALNPPLSSHYIYSNLSYAGMYSTSTITTPVIGSIPSNYRFVVKYKLADYYYPYLPPASGSGNFVVAVSTNNGTSFTDVQTVANNGIAGWQEYALNLSAYAGQNIQIRITGNNSGIGGSYSLGFDNFSVEAIPVCDYPIITVVSNSITNEAATITWTAPVNGTLPIGYEYEVRTSGEAGSGATGLIASGTTITAPAVSVNLTGLNGNTTYTYYVRSNCGGGDFSSWSSENFTTSCVSISSFPSTEPFTNYLPNSCWQEGDLGNLVNGPATIGGSSISDWVQYGFLNSGTTGAAKMTINAENESEWLLSPFYSIPSTGFRVKYSVGATNRDATTAVTNWEADDFVELLVSTSNTNWTVLKTYNASNVPSHLGQVDNIDLSAYSGQTIRFAFRSFEGTANGIADIDFFIDNFTVEQTPNIWTGATSSSWGTASNWSLNSVPTSSDNIVINSNGTNAPVMDVNVTVPVGKSLTISGMGALTIAPGKVLTIAGSADFGGRPVTFKSAATGTAMLGSLTGTLTGATNVTVERFIPQGKRAYRLLSPAVTTTTFISGNWQQGTHITGGATGGFDVTERNNSSMFTYNNQVVSGSGWTPIANTNATNLTAGVGYRILVRGDRTPTNITSASADAMNAATTLSARGTLKTGTVTLNSSSTPAINNTANSFTNNYSLVGNPYQSAVDWNAVTKSGIDATYYAWDPNMGTSTQRGRYVAFNGTTNDNASSQVGQFIQPGQAFFVKNTVSGTAGTLTFQEAHKATTSASVFSMSNQTPSSADASISMQLFDPNELAIGGYPIDAMKAVFNAEYQNTVGTGDATKLESAGENIAWFRNNTKLAIDAAAPLTTTDELLVKALRLRVNKNYTFKIQTANFDTTLTPYLVDNFLNSQTEITTSQAFLASFATTIDEASYNENRFKIVFTPSALHNDTFTNQIGLYPNPSKGNGFNLQLPSTADASVKLFNTLGQEIGLTTNGSYYQATQSLPTGVYYIMVTQGSQTSKLKWIVE